MNASQKPSPIGIIACLLQALKLLSDKRLRGLLAIPLLINSLLYSLAFYLGYQMADTLINSLIPEWLSWLNWILWPLLLLSFMVIGFFSFTLMANLIAAPFYGHLASKTLSLLNTPPTPKPPVAWQTMLVAEIRRGSYLLLRMLPLVVLFLIPGLNLLAPLIWTAFAAWGMAMEFMAYPLEEYGLLFDAQRAFVRDHRWAALSFGALIAFGMTLPLINLLIGQTAVITACIYVHNQRTQTHSTHEPKP